MKKLLPLCLALLFIITIMPAQAAQKATVINMDTGHRKVVIVGDPHAFYGGYALEVDYGVQKLPDDMLGFSVASSYKTTLSASMTSSQTTANVSSVVSKDGTTLTMGLLGTKVYLTIEPGGNKEEIIMCTGISGSAWNSCTRGLAFTGTSTAAVAANKKTHSAGSTIIMSNVHYVYDELIDLDSSETITGNKTYSGTNTFSGEVVIPTPLSTADDNAASVDYVNNVAQQGAATSTESIGGIGELATRAEMASSTYDADIPRFLHTRYATSSPDVRGVNVVVSENDGYIDSDWIRPTDNRTFSGDITFSGTQVGVGIVGEVIAYASSSVPTGWLSCTGQIVSSTTYANLWAVVGNTFGNDANGFKVPDLRGRFITMASSTLNVYTDFAETGGATSTTLTLEQIPAHTHTVPMTTNTGIAGTIPERGGDSANSLDATTGSSGEGQSHSNVEPYLVLQYIIKY